MKRIFFSWQSDSPRSTNHDLIRDCLKDAASQLDGISVELRVEDGAAGIPGTPELAAEILKRIAKADIYVADTSLCFSSAKTGAHERKAPNPNVLLELGYALHALGDRKVISVMNKAFGEPDALPFDLKHRRWPIMYCLSNEKDKTKVETVKATLTKQLATAIRTILDDHLPSEELLNAKDEVTEILTDVKESASAFQLAIAKHALSKREINEAAKNVAKRTLDLCGTITLRLASTIDIEELRVVKRQLVGLKSVLAGRPETLELLVMEEEKIRKMRNLLDRWHRADAELKSATFELTKIEGDLEEVNKEIAQSEHRENASN